MEKGRLSQEWLISKIQLLHEEALKQARNGKCYIVQNSLTNWITAHIIHLWRKTSKAPQKRKNLLICYIALYILRSSVSLDLIQNIAHELNETLNDLLKYSKWCLDDFATITSAYLWLEKLTQDFFHEDYDQLNNGNGVRYLRNITFSDLLNIEEEVKEYYLHIRSSFNEKTEKLPALEYLKKCEQLDSKNNRKFILTLKQNLLPNDYTPPIPLPSGNKLPYQLADTINETGYTTNQLLRLALKDEIEILLNCKNLAIGNDKNSGNVPFIYDCYEALHTEAIEELIKKERIEVPSIKLKNGAILFVNPSASDWRKHFALQENHKPTISPRYLQIALQDLLISEKDVTKIRDEKQNKIESSKQTESDNIFSIKNSTYTIKFIEKTINLPISNGLKQIERLLKNPEKKINCVELMQLVSTQIDVRTTDENSYELEDQGICEDAFLSQNDDQIFDKKALHDYRKKLKEIETDIKEQEAIGDTDALEQLKQERDFILNEISANSNHKKQSRKFKSNNERARQAVVNNIKNALKKLQTTHPELYTHLKKYLKTGATCHYNHTATWS